MEATHVSEVALFRKQLEETCRAFRSGLSGPAIVATHATIDAKFAALTELYDQAVPVIGEPVATQVLCEVYDTIMEATPAAAYAPTTSAAQASAA